jgi:hypothetical protein
MLANFARVDSFHFLAGYSKHFPDAQYTVENFQDRVRVGEIAATNSIVMSGESSSFTALANALMLFSSAHVGVPDAFRKFVFFTPMEPPGTQYNADLVLFNRRYLDVWMPDLSGGTIRHLSTDFALLDNDLVPFLDNDTFPQVNGGPRQIVEAHNLAVLRALNKQTEVDFYSRLERDVQIEIQFEPEHRPEAIVAALDGAEAVTTQLAKRQSFQLRLHVGAGLHRLVLGVGSTPAQVSAFRLRPD